MRKKKIIVIGCCGMPEELIQPFECLDFEPNFIPYTEITINKPPEPKYNEIQKLYANKCKEVRQLSKVLDLETTGIKQEYERPYFEDHIVHGYQNPRNEIRLSNRGRFRRQTKKRKRK